MRYQREYDFLIKVTKEAYENVIKGVDFIADDKGEKDLVTTLDIATEKYIIEKINQEFPDDHIVSEEGNAKEQLKGRSWVIDPIDGTNNFANRLPIWVVQMAFVVDGVTMCSVVYAPVFDETVSAHLGEGVYLNGKKQPPLKEKPNNQLLLGVDTDQVIRPLIFNPKTMPLYLKTRMYGSAGYVFGSTAIGRFGGYMIQTRNLWDILPGKLLCEEAGIKVYERDIRDRHITIAINNKKFLEALDFENIE